MYKSNGEEIMTNQEAMRLRQQVAERRREREQAAARIAEVLGTDMYAALAQNSDPREELIAAVYSGAR